MSTGLVEYTYDDAPEPLDDREALETYTREKASNPSALVTLDQYNCGQHWKVTVRKTPQEKEDYLRQVIKKMMDKIADGMTTTKTHSNA